MAPRKKTAKKKKPPQGMPPGGWPKVDGKSRAQHVRDYLAEHPDENWSKAEASLKKLGITSTMFSSVKSKIRRPPGKGGGRVTVETLHEVKEFAAKIGGLNKLRDAVIALESLVK